MSRGKIRFFPDLFGFFQHFLKPDLTGHCADGAVQNRRDYPSLIASDGIHLTEAGYGLLFQEFRRVLMTALCAANSPAASNLTEKPSVCIIQTEGF